MRFGFLTPAGDLFCRQTSFDVQNSRNLLKIESANQKKRRLKHGSQTVIKFFTGEFPKTKHLLETLRVDVVHESVS